MLALLTPVETLERFPIESESALTFCFVAFSEREPVSTSLGNTLAVTKAVVFVMPMFSGGDVQKRPEAAFLRVVKAVVERFCRIGEFI